MRNYRQIFIESVVANFKILFKEKPCINNIFNAIHPIAAVGPAAVDRAIGGSSDIALVLNKHVYTKLGNPSTKKTY